MQNNKNVARLQPKIVKIAIAIFAVTILYTVFGFVGLPYIVKSILPEKLSKALNRQVSISKVAVNPYSLTLLLKGLTGTIKRLCPLMNFLLIFKLHLCLKKH